LQTPVLYVTGCTGDVLARHGVVETEGTLLRKPFTPRALAEAVRALLDCRTAAATARVQ
jgi:DNA-binding response OmpR family regulator